MPAQPLKLDRRDVRMHTSVLNPAFASPTVLSTDIWSYVRLALQRDKPNSEAALYWSQAEEFFTATLHLGTAAAPLTAYYSILNAAKALLSKRNVVFAEAHGVSGDGTGTSVFLAGELVEIKTGGILPHLADQLGHKINASVATNLRDVLRELPFVHRAFCLTFRSDTEVFLPLAKTGFVEHPDSGKIWFTAEVNPAYWTSNTVKVLPTTLEHDKTPGMVSGIRSKNRRIWDLSTAPLRNASLQRLSNLHADLRENVVPVIAATNRWYLRKKLKKHPSLGLPIPVLIFAAMHRLSELARYDPPRLQRHLQAQHNWLLTEFVRVAPAQFVYYIASELTGQEFVRPDAAALGS